MAKQKFNNKLARKILTTVAEAIAVGGLSLTLMAMPGMATVVKEFIDWYNKQNSKYRFTIRKTFEELRRARLVEYQEINGITKIIILEKGKKKILQYQIDDLKIPKMKKWDKKWRFVIFDIPEKQKKARKAFRDKLNVLGFYFLQKSVWVYPFECHNQIDFATKVFGISPHVRIIEAVDFDGSEEIKKIFFG